MRLIAGVTTLILVGALAWIAKRAMAPEEAGPRTVVAQGLSAESRDPTDFRPRLIEFISSHDAVRPGGSFGYEMRFVNEGTETTTRDYVVFLHFEEVSTDGCREIAFQKDKPAIERPTYTWQPGERVVVGPRVMYVPQNAEEGLYRMHVGLFDLQGDGHRIAEGIGGEIRVSWSAPPTGSVWKEWQPEPISPVEVAERRKALATRLRSPLVIDTEEWSFALDGGGGSYLLTDKSTGAVWGTSHSYDRWGAVTVASGGREVVVPIHVFDRVERWKEGLRARVALTVDGEPIGIVLTVTYEPVEAGEGLRIRSLVHGDSEWTVVSIKPLDRSLFTTDADRGYTVLPHHLGLVLPTDHGLPSTVSFSTCDQITMGMCGQVKQESALLLAWSHPGVTLGLHISIEDSPYVGGRRTHSLSLTLSAGAECFEIYPLGRDDYAGIARRYRRWAGERDMLLSWEERRGRWPETGRLVGAGIFRPGVLDRLLPGTPSNNSSEERVLVNFTFDEVARCAEHWRNTLELDRAAVILTGWNRRGYDNELPDILPANEECGGNEGLAECGRRIQELGFLFGLHDNYLDIFTNAPSWDPSLVNKDSTGAYRAQRVWSGGLSYQVCASQQPVLAERNWPTMRELFAPDMVYLDTTLVAPLQICQDPEHPMTRLDDQRAKRTLFELARQHFPLVGSEGGTEWAVPHVDQFGGILTHRTIGSRGKTVVPLVPIVYGDCLSLNTMQGDRIGVADAKKVLDHILYAEMPIYEFGDHLYFEGDGSHGLPLRVRVDHFAQVTPTRFRMSYSWDVQGEITGDHDIFVHFIHRHSEMPEQVSFQSNHTPTVPTSGWRSGDVIEIGPLVSAFTEDLDGRYEVWIGLDQDGRRKLFRDVPSHQGRHHIGTLIRHGESIEFEPPDTNPTSGCFARGDDGWGAHLVPTDRVIKNTWEVLTWLNRITHDRPMSSHAFLEEGVERTTFGDAVVTVNYAEKPYSVDGTVLPQFGFLVASPTFEAFHTLRHRGIDYPGGAMFTVRSLDEKPISESRRTRIFHAFGRNRIALGNEVVSVVRERVVVR